MPNAFTEMGVAMLSSMLRSSMAIQVNINYVGSGGTEIFPIITYFHTLMELKSSGSG